MTVKKQLSLAERIKKICEQEGVSLRAWIAIEAELQAEEQKRVKQCDICNRCGEMRFSYC